MSIISVGMDIVIMLLLAATIFYAIKLSKHLDTFRSNRADMEHLIRELSSQITRAQEGISVLDELSSSRGDELRTSINRAHAISDELQLITETGNSLATRLENLAARSRAATEDEVKSHTQKMIHPKYEDTLKRSEMDDVIKSETAPAKKTPFFAIRDPDYDEESNVPPLFDENNNGEFLSQAERELAQALERRTPKRK